MELTPDAATILFEIANFLVLTALLYWFLFRPLMRRVRSRAEEKERLMKEIAQERDRAEKLRKELEARLARAGEEADAIVAEAQKRAEEAREQILQETQAEVERILADAHAEAQRVRQEALEAAKSEALTTILDISAQLMGRAAPPEFHDALVQQLCDRIWEMGRSEMMRVDEFRRSLGTRTPTAYVTTARPLTPEQQGLLVRTFTALADRHVNLELETDPSLIAGLRVRLGDTLVDNSIAGQMEALRRETLEALKE